MASELIFSPISDPIGPIIPKSGLLPELLHLYLHDQRITRHHRFPELHLETIGRRQAGGKRAKGGTFVQHIANRNGILNGIE